MGWAAVAGGGAIAGIGFTVSILIADARLPRRRLEEAKLGVLCAALVASAATWTLFRATERLPKRWRLRALIGSARPLSTWPCRSIPSATTCAVRWTPP